MNPWEMDWGPKPAPAAAPKATGKPWERDWGNGPKPQPTWTAPTLSPETEAMNKSAEQAIAETSVKENPNFGRAASFSHGLPFVGPWLDEAMGAFNPEAGTRMERARLSFEAARPDAAQAGEMMGTLTGSVATLGAGLPSLLSKPGLGLRMATGLGLGGLFGGGEAASRAAGDAPPGERMGAAVDAAPTGALVGAGVGTLAPAVATGASTALQSLRGSDVAQIAQALGISEKAARAVKAAVGGEDLARAGAQLARGGDDAMLMEGGPSLQSLAKGTMASGGEATRVVRQAVDDRAAGAAAKMKGALDDTLGVPAGRADAAANIRRASRKARGDAYDAAYATPIDYASPAGRRIESLLARAPSKTMNAAINKANEVLKYDDGAKQIMASIGPDGAVTFKEMPNAMQLDEIKRAFDKIVQDGTDPVTGKMSSDATFASRVARDIRNAHAAANPNYVKALQTGMDTAQSTEAVETGYKSLTVTPEATARALRGSNKDARAAAKIGLRQYIDDQMGAARAIMSRPGLGEDGIGEAQTAIRTLSSRRARDAMTMIVGKDGTEKLMGQIDEMKTAFEIQAALSRNSDTAVNQAVQGSIDASTAPSVVGKLMEGSPIDATKRFAQLFTGATPEAREAAKAGIWSDIAKALTTTKGADAERALVVVNKAIAGQKITAEEAQGAGRLIATVLGAGAYREGTRALSLQ